MSICVCFFAYFFNLNILTFWRIKFSIYVELINSGLLQPDIFLIFVGNQFIFAGATFPHNIKNTFRDLVTLFV